MIYCIYILKNVQTEMHPLPKPYIPGTNQIISRGILWAWSKYFISA